MDEIEPYIGSHSVSPTQISLMRDPKTGHFLPKNKIGIPNLFAEAAPAARCALTKALTKEKLKEMMEMAVQKACEGNLGFLHEILDRILGKAKEHHTVDGNINVTNTLLLDSSTSRIELITKIIAERKGDTIMIEGQIIDK